MQEGQRPGMEADSRSELEARAILSIAIDGMAARSELNAELVGPPGLRADFHEAQTSMGSPLGIVQDGLLGPRRMRLNDLDLALVLLLAQPIFERAGRLLGRAMAGVVHTIDPNLMVIQGEGVTAWRYWQASFETSFRRHLMPARRALRYQVDEWSEERWTLGAASLVLAAPFDATDATGDQGRQVRARLQGLETS